LQLQFTLAATQDISCHRLVIAMQGEFESVGKQRLKHRAQRLGGRIAARLGDKIEAIPVHPRGEAVDRVLLNTLSEDDEFLQGRIGNFDAPAGENAALAGMSIRGTARLNIGDFEARCPGLPLCRA
jgi:hypothetical protein